MHLWMRGLCSWKGYKNWWHPSWLSFNISWLNKLVRNKLVPSCYIEENVDTSTADIPKHEQLTPKQSKLTNSTGNGKICIFDLGWIIISNLWVSHFLLNSIMESPKQPLKYDPTVLFIYKNKLSSRQSKHWKTGWASQ